MGTDCTLVLMSITAEKKLIADYVTFGN